jgi:two-component sensor histidine kinase
MFFVGPADITVTPELWERPPRAPDIDAEVAAIRRLADAMSSRPDDLFQLCAELGRRLCRADACGISVCERDENGQDVFRCIALTGEMTERLPRISPRYFSPCGICVDTQAPVLMRRPARVYKYLDVGVPLHDLLLIPLTEPDSHLLGTIWLISNDPSRKFDAEDARTMQRIAVFTATALHNASELSAARQEAEMQRTLFKELDHRVRNTLTMTVAVLRGQLGGISDPSARAAIETATSRVMALGQLHRVGPGAASGDLAQVIEAICHDLTDDTAIHCDLDLEPALVPAPKAAVVALVVNELVTNVVKHAFKGRPPGSMRIELRRLGNDVQIAISDDGAPLPASAVAGHSAGMGLNLLHRLVDHLEGTLMVEAATKRFIVLFSAHDIAPSVVPQMAAIGAE